MRRSGFETAHILIVDDHEANVKLLHQLLSHAGYRSITTTTDPRQVLPLFMTKQPDLILLDLHMPHLDGYAVLEQLEPRVPHGTYLPILVLTADATPEAKQRALSSGAKDFLAKPFDQGEVLLRVANLLETRALHQILRNQNKMLEEKVRERTHDIDEAQVETLTRLALAAEYRDDETGHHAQRVGRTAGLIAAELGMASDEVELVRRAAPLHDLGKIGIGDEILLKPGKLTDAEFAEMKNHTTIGARILSGSRFQLLQFAEDIALTHHERWDGTGYVGLKGEAIPLVGRIVTVADVFDALTHERPYKPAWDEAEAISEITGKSGSQFDPDVVEAFLTVAHATQLREPNPQELGPSVPSTIDIQDAALESVAV